MITSTYPLYRSFNSIFIGENPNNLYRKLEVQVMEMWKLAGDDDDFEDDDNDDNDDADEE